VYWATALGLDAKLELVKAMMPAFYGAQEVIMIPDSLCIVRRGVMGLNGTILGHGDVWGHESVLLETKALLRRCSPRTLTYVDLLCISRQDVLHVGTLLPKAAEQLRRAQVKVAVRMAFVFVAKLIKEGKSLPQAVSSFGYSPKLAGSTQPSGTSSRKGSAGRASTVQTPQSKQEFARSLRSQILSDAHEILAPFQSGLAERSDFEELRNAVSQLKRTVASMAPLVSG